MALTQTTLTAPCAASDLRLTLTSTTGFLPNQAIRIDSETMYCTQVVSPTVVGVRSRGADGSIAMFHDIGSNVEISGAAGDYGTPALGEATQVPTYAPPVITLGSITQTLALPSEDTIYVFNNTAMITANLPAPDKAHDGLKLTFTSMSAAAHKVVSPAALATGVTGGPFGTGTLAAFRGASLMLLACQGQWNVLAQNPAATFA